MQVDVTARSVRPISLIPRPPRMEILDHGAPQNALFLEALRKALDEKGIQYSVVIASADRRAPEEPEVSSGGQRTIA